jgi:hypothetical protein
MRYSSQKNPESGIKAALSALSPKVRKALLESHKALTELGIPHVVVGGIAVGAHGVPRATKDVDFLVADSAFTKHGKLVAFAPGVPIQVDGIMIDYLSIVEGKEMEKLVAQVSKDLTVVPIEQLMYMKLVANRPKDVGDVLALLEAGIDSDGVREWLAQHAPEVVARFDRMVRRSADGK